MIIILCHPQIPANTGNIVRTCHATGSELVLVHPLGFKTDDKSLRRAGLDYWEGVKVTIIDDLMDYLEKAPYPFYFLSSKATKFYSEAKFEERSILIFGSEVAGLPPEFFERWPEKFLTIPMKEGCRCLNLSNAAAIVLYEALRQNLYLLS
ncbi:tRNA (cytidine(34)-2'-O)-methyltransferase [Candidatus Neptunochlamydia vexilliferae]|uniref:Putative tRNA (cytidine(34)-2'-O)-methyltransferase n=1 Tax=Candidatus Neptunichlamydia vexilliferae TaxID=1651774 RepID=A0ABS0AXL6_9BACT|nr:tRNA (cytidine(34)-2'-O)-methyltransferase [Candidatus Neptunochlamydia vexilliferae]MBF5058704.1 putative tRNA (cytidine(34)-2'-O)-methyltransferase [Candidatus Neptunochlamydia vexilliferae]